MSWWCFKNSSRADKAFHRCNNTHQIIKGKKCWIGWGKKRNLKWPSKWMTLDSSAIKSSQGCLTQVIDNYSTQGWRISWEHFLQVITEDLSRNNNLGQLFQHQKQKARNGSQIWAQVLRHQYFSPSNQFIPKVRVHSLITREVVRNLLSSRLLTSTTFCKPLISHLLGSFSSSRSRSRYQFMFIHLLMKIIHHLLGQRCIISTRSQAWIIIIL